MHHVFKYFLFPMLIPIMFVKMNFVSIKSNNKICLVSHMSSIPFIFVGISAYCILQKHRSGMDWKATNKLLLLHR